MRTEPIAALLTVALAGTVGAHLGDIVYPIYELPTSDLPDLHDGTLEDWEEVLPGGSLDHIYFVQDIGEGIDPSDLAWRVFLAWNSASQQIYMAAELLDDFYGSDGHDRVGFSVDGDHSGGQYANFASVSEEESKGKEFAQAQAYNVVPERSDDRSLLYAAGSARWAASSPWADAGGFQYGESPHLWVVELAITPWDDLNWEGPELSRQSVLAAGGIIGFHIDVYDWDRDPLSAGWYRLVLSETEGPGRTGDRTVTHDLFAENFVDGELIPCHRGDCSGASTAVSQDSWARIKASFR